MFFTVEKNLFACSYMCIYIVYINLTIVTTYRYINKRILYIYIHISSDTHTLVWQWFKPCHIPLNWF